MKFIKSFLLAALVIICFASASMADAIVNVVDPAHYEDVWNSQTSSWKPYAYYANSGELLFVEPGNNQGAHLIDVQNKLNSIAGYENVILTEVNITWTGYGSATAAASGTWTVNPLTSVIDFYIVKAANAYAMYLVDPADDMGSWSTFDLWIQGYGGKGPLEISHVTGYNPHCNVPVPTTVLLLGSGLWGVLAYGRKRIKA